MTIQHAWASRLGAVAIVGGLAFSLLGVTPAVSIPVAAEAKQVSTGSAQETLYPGLSVTSKVVPGGVVTIAYRFLPCDTLRLRVGSQLYSYSMSDYDLVRKVKAPTKVGTVRVTAVCDAYGREFHHETSFRVVPGTPKLSLVGKSSKSKTAKLTIRLTLDGQAAKSAPVKVYDGKRYRKTVTVKSGKASVTLTKLKRGSHWFTVKYANPNYKSASKKIKVRVR